MKGDSGLQKLTSFLDNFLAFSTSSLVYSRSSDLFQQCQSFVVFCVCQTSDLQLIGKRGIPQRLATSVLCLEGQCNKGCSC